MTPLELAAHAEELAARATKGPWVERHRNVFCTPSDDESAGLGLEVVGPKAPGLRGTYKTAADAHFIAASRDLVPQLAAALKDACELLAGTVTARTGAWFWGEGYCFECGAHDTPSNRIPHRPGCSVGKQEAFLARDVEVTDAS